MKVTPVKNSKIRRSDMSLKRIVTKFADPLIADVGTNSVKDRYVQNTCNETKMRIKMSWDE